MRRITALLASLGLVLSLAPATLATNTSTGTWIVTLRGGADPGASARSLVGAHGGEVEHVYRHALQGFAFRGSSAAASVMSRNPNVVRVEADAEVWLDTTQSNATWGLDRIDQRELPLSQTYSYTSTGANVTAYVIDSGILTGHQEFGGRASIGIDLVGTNEGQDCNGHGTHVAGTIGGSTYGVAKAVSLVAVRVFDCSGGSAWSTIIAGIDWIIGDHGADELAVANMSLSGGGNASVDEAVQRMIGDGISTAVAAGNGNFIGRQDDACKYSPARVPEAMTISATDKADKKASWANYGNCVDWFAPGVSITSAWHTSTSATNTISGTSMASPHSAGVAALYLELNPIHQPAQVAAAISAQTTQGIVTSSSTAKNNLLYSGFIGAVGGDGGGGGGGGGGGETTTISLSASGYKIKGVQHADLTWSGATSNVDVYRNGAKITTTDNDGAHTDNIGNKGGGSYTYKLCEAGTSTCSNEVVVSY